MDLLAERLPLRLNVSTPQAPLDFPCAAFQHLTLNSQLSTINLFFTWQKLKLF